MMSAPLGRGRPHVKWMREVRGPRSVSEDEPEAGVLRNDIVLIRTDVEALKNGSGGCRVCFFLEPFEC